MRKRKREPSPDSRHPRQLHLYDYPETLKQVRTYLTHSDISTLARASKRTTLAVRDCMLKISTCTLGPLDVITTFFIPSKHLRFAYDTIYIQLFGIEQPAKLKLWATTITDSGKWIGHSCIFNRIVQKNKQHLYMYNRAIPHACNSEVVIHGKDIKPTQLNLTNSNWLGDGDRFKSDIWANNGIDESVHYMAARAKSDTSVVVVLIPIKFIT